MTDYEDLTITCRDCHKPFVLTARDQAFFASMTDSEGKPFKNPARCKPCRNLKKSQKMTGTFQPSQPQTPQVIQVEDSRGGKKRTGGGRRRERDEEW